MTMNNQNYPSQPQFRAPNHNPNQPVMPPPQVRPAIQQQAQLLHHPAQRPSSIGPGQGQTAQQEQSPVQPPAPAQAQGQTQPQGGTP
ncbi:601e266f-0bef-44c6-9105-c09d224af031 [Thermothielavioides terrestris]|uniref:601e266f-0bef-44c6-9105-c09d224af031 n=2 Tax=Thermothielavioides terrestris TaxID=2587410 RepID=A0A3S4AN24_9PEZI|nr:601e266f-0bef-44c6-9105-c09d224af031 [Thermothielavioides terrestris]